MFGGMTGRKSAEALRDLRRYLGKADVPRSALKDARLAQGMTQAELEAASGIGQARISQIETGERPLSHEAAVGLAGPLGVTPEALAVAVRLGNLRRALDGDGSSSAALLSIELMGLAETILPAGDLRNALLEMLSESLQEAIAVDKARMRELQEKEAAAAKIATKTRRKKDQEGAPQGEAGDQVAVKSKQRAGRDQWGRKVREEPRPEVALKTRDGMGRSRDKSAPIQRDALGRNVANRRNADAGR